MQTFYCYILPQAKLLNTAQVCIVCTKASAVKLKRFTARMTESLNVPKPATHREMLSGEKFHQITHTCTCMAESKYLLASSQDQFTPAILHPYLLMTNGQ